MPKFKKSQTELKQINLTPSPLGGITIPTGTTPGNSIMPLFYCLSLMGQTLRTRAGIPTVFLVVTLTLLF